MFQLNTTKLGAEFAGEEYGLQLVLDVGAKYSLLRGLTESFGVKVVIHEPDMFPLTTNQGYSIATNAHTKIGLDRTVT